MEDNVAQIFEAATGLRLDDVPDDVPHRPSEVSEQRGSRK